MKTEIIKLKAINARCRMCEGNKVIPRGNTALKITMYTNSSSTKPVSSFFCLEHAQEIKDMFSILNISLAQDL